MPRTHNRRCWMLTTALGGAFIALMSVGPDRSRDNLPNPDPQHPYVPKNMPAVGDLFDMFDFN
jgi:hypothetical protein